MFDIAPRSHFVILFVIDHMAIPNEQLDRVDSGMENGMCFISDARMKHTIYNVGAPMWSTIGAVIPQCTLYKLHQLVYSLKV